ELEAHSRLEAFEKRESELTAREKEHRRVRNELATERLLVEDERSALEQRIERIAGARINNLESELAARIAERDNAREERDRLQELLRLRASADAKFGDRSVEDVLRYITSL